MKLQTQNTEKFKDKSKKYYKINYLYFYAFPFYDLIFCCLALSLIIVLREFKCFVVLLGILI